MWNKLELLPKTDLPRDKVVYLHRRGSDGIPFYVGIGVEKRPEVVEKRNADWTTVYEAHGRTVEILFKCLLHWHAKTIEIVLIAQYRFNYGKYREGGSMVNLSDGGEGSSGWTPTEEQKLKQIAAQTGRGHSEESRVKMSASKIGELNPMHGRTGEESPNYGREKTEETRTKLSEAGTGKFGEQHNSFQGYSVGINEELFVILAGMKEMKDCGFSQSHISACILGNRNSHKGFTWTRQNTLNPEEFAGLTPFNELSAERLNAAKNS